MPASPTRAAYLAGLRAGLPFLLVIVPFALVFGVAASEAGWSLAQTMGMTVGVIAGASQFTALQLIADQAPMLVVIATALAVNLRMAMYSASMAPHIGAAPLWTRALAAYVLVDQTYGTAISHYTLHPGLGRREKLAYFFGAVTPVCGPWYAATYAGAVAGAAIPPAFALDFAVPITFIALVAPALRSLPHLAAAFVSAAAALALVWMPFSLGLLVAAMLAMLAGAGVERWLEARG
jgi:predicted branched-subunit amino acid permease